MYHVYRNGLLASKAKTRKQAAGIVANMRRIDTTIPRKQYSIFRQHINDGKLIDYTLVYRRAYGYGRRTNADN